jgi:hypothetical protein
MFGRPGSNRTNPRISAPERSSNRGSGSGATVAWPDAGVEGADGERADDGFASPPEFDPVWGTLGAPVGQGDEGWPSGKAEPADGVVVDVELLGDGFHFSGRIHLGQFDRLSGWLNMQSGFIQLRDARHVHPGIGGANEAQPGSILWVRLDQIVVVADQSPVQRVRSGVAVVEKQRHGVSILARGFELSGNIHIHEHGQIAQFLEANDPRFLPITELTVRRLSGSGLPERFPSAMVNREQLVTLLEDAELAESDVSRREVRSA